jgi:hypothetical protein
MLFIYISFINTVSIQDYRVWVDIIRRMCLQMKAVLTSGQFPEGPKTTTKISGHDRQWPSGDSKRTSLDYMPQALQPVNLLGLSDVRGKTRGTDRLTDLTHFTFCVQTMACQQELHEIVFKALCYKPEGRGFDTRWGEFLNLPNPSGSTRPWGLLSL